MYVLVRTDGAYVARPGSQASYTRVLQDARVFVTRESAERDRCVDNERIESIDSIMRGNHAS